MGVVEPFVALMRLYMREDLPPLSFQPSHFILIPTHITTSHYAQLTRRYLSSGRFGSHGRDPAGCRWLERDQREYYPV
jgi:hypothetical protein